MSKHIEVQKLVLRTVDRIVEARDGASRSYAKAVVIVRPLPQSSCEDLRGIP